MPRFTIPPQYPAAIDWANPITRGLAFAYQPGFLRDAVTGKPATKTGGAYAAQGGSIVTQGTVVSTGITTGTGALLAPLANSTLIAVAARYNSTTNLSAGGSSIYCERGSSGNDIFKLGWGGPGNGAEFTHRDDAATLSQVRAPLANSQITDNAPHFYAVQKFGTGCNVFADDSVANIGSGLGAGTFTDATLTRTIGSDFGDASAMWDGRIDLVAGWSRTLSDAEIKSLRANPSQLFKQRLRFPPYVSQNLPLTGTMPAAQSPNAAALTGAVATSGASALAQGAQSAALTGAVANPPARTGAIPAAPAPNAATLTGTVSLSGSVPAVQRQTAVLTGGPVVGGTAALQQGAPIPTITATNTISVAANQRYLIVARVRVYAVKADGNRVLSVAARPRNYTAKLQ